MSKITPALLKHIEEQIEDIDYGRIIIELRGTSDKIDIITETRQRFDKN